MEHYNKFYEIGQNKYYTLNVDDELFIATESFINVGRKKLFRKQKTLTQGFKLLKFSSPIAILFNEAINVPSISKKDVDEDMLEYEHIDNKALKAKIKDSYNQAFEESKNELSAWYKDSMKHFESMDEDTTEKEIQCREYYKNTINVLDSQNPLANGTININQAKHTECNIVRAMARENMEHLYTERVTAFAKNIFMYEQDCFGTITIYRVMTVKNVVKSIDSFIYDRKLINELLKNIYENDMKEGN